MAIELDDIKSGYNLSKINSNFQKIEDELKNKLSRAGVEVGQANQMTNTLDMNDNKMINLHTDENDPNSVLTVAGGDNRYVNASGDSMSGELNMLTNAIRGLPQPSLPTDAASKEYVDNITIGLQDLPAKYVKDFGVVGDYDTDDTMAFKTALAWCDTNDRALNLGDLNIRVTESIDFPNIVIFGNGSPKLAHFPLIYGDKNLLRPGFKHKISGASIFFDGVADKTYATNRSDRYASMSYAFSFKHYEACRLHDFAMILDVDVKDAGGNFTTSATDNSSDADAIFISQGTLGEMRGVTIFGYSNDAGYVIHNQDGDVGFIDPDYNSLTDCIINGGVAILGHDAAAGIAVEGGLTGQRFTACGIYGAEHHIRSEGDYTRPAVFIDGYMGDNDQSGIRSHIFTNCNIRTYANEAIVTDHCNDVAFIGNTFEFSTIAGVPNADQPGEFVGTRKTRRFRAIANGATDSVGMLSYASQISGPFQIIGAGGYDEAMFGANGKFIRVGSGRGGDESIAEPYVQFSDNPLSTVGGWKLHWEVSDDSFTFRKENQVVFGIDPDGGLRHGGLGMAKGNLTIASGAITVGSYDWIVLSTEGGAPTDNLVNIAGGKYAGHRIMLSTALSSQDVTVLGTSGGGGNVRMGSDFTLSSGFDMLELMWNGAFWVGVSRSDNG